MVGILIFVFSLVSWIVTIAGLVNDMRWVSSIILSRMPLMLSWSILKSFGSGLRKVLSLRGGGLGRRALG